MMRVLPLFLLAAALVPARSGEGPASPALPLRIWVDEFFFAGGETVLLREAVAQSAGAAVVSGTTNNRVFQLKSYQLAEHVDVMWTGQKGCYEAFKRRLNTSHAVSCVPGTNAVTAKAALVTSLAAAYGQAAWSILPQSFRLPQEYSELAAQLKEDERSGASSMWVLKEDVHRGKGVGVVTAHQALFRALERAPDGGRRHVLAQRFLSQQYLVQGRPFYVRLWVVLMGADPARAHLFDGGVAVFGQRQRQGQAADSLIVNLWTQDRAAAAPWSLRQLEQHMAAESGSNEVPRRLRRQIHAAVAASLAAALPAVRQSSGRLAGFQGGSFEVLGVDFLVDAQLRPWLVEVNRMPSLARKVVACADNSSSSSGSNEGGSTSGEGGGGGCQRDVPFDQEKERFVGALLRLLTDRHVQHASLAQQAQRVLQDTSDAAAEGELPPCVSAQQLHQLLEMRVEQAAAQRLGFVSLTPLMYKSLACMAARPVPGSDSSSSSSSSSNDNSNSSSSSSSACDVLAELVPPAPASQQVCTAPPAANEALLARLGGLASRLRLEAVSLLHRLWHPAARHRPAQVQASGPYQRRESDKRLLEWMQQGSPPLDTPQALHDFCALGAASAAAE
ncbi:Tubulin polyglutamylase TTLL5 [Chlorella vulgaris]